MNDVLPAELRLESRSNIFVTAILLVDGRPGLPARVRDVSASGAPIEAADRRRETAITLVRGDRIVIGQIAWNRGGRTGVAFAAPVNVPCWLPSTRLA